MENKHELNTGELRQKLLPLSFAHAMWRMHFFKATGYTPPQKSLFGEEMDELFSSARRSRSTPAVPLSKSDGGGGDETEGNDAQNRSNRTRETHSRLNRDSKGDKRSASQRGGGAQDTGVDESERHLLQVEEQRSSRPKTGKVLKKKPRPKEDRSILSHDDSASCKASEP